MARFLDDIRAAGAFRQPWFIPPEKERAWALYAKAMWERISAPDLPVLLIDNVAEYYFEGTDQEYWSLDKDFPNLAPPWPMFWAEHKIAKTIHSTEGDTDTTRLLQNGRVGALFCSADPEGVTVADGELPAGTRWVLMCDMWIDYGTREPAQGPGGAVFLCIDDAGRALAKPWMQSFARAEHEEQMRLSIGWFNPAFLAISFLHCKNVVLEDRRVDKPLAKKYRERHGITPTAYKTLVIEPLKAILKREGGSDQHGLAKAMHICRGHFADYREGRGLFGKYKKLVWIPQTLRGTTGKAAPREVEIKL